MPTLLITGEDGFELSVALGERHLRIGRSAENDVVLPDVDNGASRAHAELSLENGRYVITDLRSLNGTWVNGERIQRADVGPDAEIAIGKYRLRVVEGRPDLPIRPRPPVLRKESTAKIAADADSRGTRTPQIAALVAALAAIAVAAWWWEAGRLPVGDPPAHGSQEVATPSAATETASNAKPAAAETDAAPAGQASNVPARSTAARTTGSSSTKRGLVADAPVARRPGESVQAWYDRAAALQARYTASKAALDRGDFAGAAGGFQTILKDEPAFFDVPELLVKARDGLRAAARDALDTGNRFDAAGDWISALGKYEQARQIDPMVPGLDAAVKRVRDKVRTAGNDALRRAQQFDVLGRPADAVKEYEKAAQWLPSDDPKHDMALSRAEQLKAGLK